MSPWTIYIMGFAHGAVVCSVCAVCGYRSGRRALPPAEKGDGHG